MRVSWRMGVAAQCRDVILSHNHPSGVAVPSADDVASTARLRDALALFDVGLLEHFVVGEVSTAVAGSARAPGRGR